jgi:hypothetical protein
LTIQGCIHFEQGLTGLSATMHGHHRTKGFKVTQGGKVTN